MEVKLHYNHPLSLFEYTFLQKPLFKELSNVRESIREKILDNDQLEHYICIGKSRNRKIRMIGKQDIFNIIFGP
jgi:hypothetical protein